MVTHPFRGLVKRLKSVPRGGPRPRSCLGSSWAKGLAQEERKDLPGRGPEGWGSQWSRSGMGKDATLSPQLCIS